MIATHELHALFGLELFTDRFLFRGVRLRRERESISFPGKKTDATLEHLPRDILAFSDHRQIEYSDEQAPVRPSMGQHTSSHKKMEESERITHLGDTFGMVDRIITSLVDVFDPIRIRKSEERALLRLRIGSPWDLPRVPKHRVGAIAPLPDPAPSLSGGLRGFVISLVVRQGKLNPLATRAFSAHAGAVFVCSENGRNPEVWHRDGGERWTRVISSFVI